MALTLDAALACATSPMRLSATQQVPSVAACAHLDFDQVYGDYAPFVWTNARRLGVAESSLDDVVQDVFLVVHRRLEDYRGQSSVKTWVCGILMNVVREHRRRIRRKEGNATSDSASRIACTDAAPDDRAAAAEALRVVNAVLERMSEAKREAIVLSQLEGMSIPEIAAATGENVNTIYARVRAARREFDEIYEAESSSSGPRKGGA